MLQGPGVGDRYIRLHDVQEVLNAECNLVEEALISRSEWVNGISYDTPYYGYYIDLRFDESAMPEPNPYSGEGEPFGAVIQADIYDFDLGLSVNGKSVQMLTISGGKEYERSVWIVDGEIYIPTYTVAKLLGYKI